MKSFTPRPLSWIQCCLLAISIPLAGALCSLQGAEVSREPGFHPRAFAIIKARLVLAPGQEIESGNLILRDGLIVAAAADAPIPDDADVIDGTGLIVYAGFVDAGTTTLLDEIKPPATPDARPVDFGRHALAATRPDNRKGLTPELAASEHLKLVSGELEERRKLGITSLHIVPSGRLASGLGTLVSTSGAPVRECIIAHDTVSELQLFAMPQGDYPRTLMGGTAHLRQAFLDAQHHARHQQLYSSATDGIARPAQDPALEALQTLLEGKRRVQFRAELRDDIHRALSFAEEFKLQPILWGGEEAHRCIDLLKEKQIPVVVDVDFGDEPKIEAPSDKKELNPDEKPPLRAQQAKLDEWKKVVATPARLHEAGIQFAFGSQGVKKPGDFLKGVRQAITAGLPREAALAALTRDAATLLGQESRLGTLAPGKLGHVIVLTGPFDNEQSKVRYVFVDGQKYEYHSDAKPVPVSTAGDELDLTGTWTIEIEAAAGKHTGTLFLSQTGERLNGTFQSPQGNGKVTSGTATAKNLKFTVAIGAGDTAVELKFEGTPIAEKSEKKIHELNGHLKSAFGAATTWKATREKSAADTSTNPVQLGLDDIDADTNNKDKQVTQQDELPTEIEADRLRRPVKTGGNVFIQNATVLTGLGETLTETSILVQDGKIKAIGRDLKPEAGIHVIDAAGRYVMPGIIDTHSHIMISQGINEASQSIVPEVRIKDVIDTADPSAYRALAGGVTTARLLHGSANVIGGQDAVVKLKYGLPARAQILHDAPQGVKFALGENVKFQQNRFPNTRMGVEATLNRAFLEAVDYRRQWMEYERAVEAAGEKRDQLLAPRRDLRLEALMDIVNHQKFIHSHCYRADEILMLLRVASNLGIRVWSLQHVLEGYKIAPEIVAHGASCSTFADWWAYKIEAYDAVPHNAALLREAGANVVIKSDDWELIRHLYQEAAKTVRYGNMSPEHALQAITLHPARELGLQDRIGSIEVGKDADLAIFSGHPLNAFSRCEQTLIEGEIYFTRAEQPSAMSVEAAKRSGTPPTLEFTPPEVRQRKLELREVPSGEYALVGGTLHPVEGDAIPGGTLLIANGRISALGKDIAIPSDAHRIDVTGLHVYPGLIDAGTTLGLVEVGKVRETHDYSESGTLQPDLRAGVAINPDSELIPVSRTGGITTILARPTGGTIAGQASLVQLAGWTVPEMVLNYEAGLQINWPQGNNAKERIQQLEKFIEEARLYHRIRGRANPDREVNLIADPRLDAMRPYLDGEKPVLIEADTRKQIAEALLFAEKEKLKMILTGGTDAWKLADELKKRDVPVILGPVMRKPIAEYDPFDAPYANAGRLFEAGVTFCIRSNNASNSRNAPFEAAMAVAYGLPESEGLKAVTLTAAKILGIEPELGSLRVGKQASLIITDGSPLQPVTQIYGVFVAGKPHLPESRQTRLYEKYRARVTSQKASAPAAASVSP